VGSKQWALVPEESHGERDQRARWPSTVPTKDARSAPRILYEPATLPPRSHLPDWLAFASPCAYLPARPEPSLRLPRGTILQRPPTADVHKPAKWEQQHGKDELAKGLENAKTGKNAVDVVREYYPVCDCRSVPLVQPMLPRIGRPVALC
jgi:hypothetical protein